MTSDPLMAWLERKRVDRRVQTGIPDPAALANAYRRAVRQTRGQAVIKEALPGIEEDEERSIPSALNVRIQEKRTGSAHAWDAGLWDVEAPDEQEADKEACGEEDPARPA